LNTSTNLLTIEAGGVWDVLEIEEISSNEKTASEEIVIITGKITVSP